MRHQESCAETNVFKPQWSKAKLHRRVGQKFTTTMWGTESHPEDDDFKLLQLKMVPQADVSGNEVKFSHRTFSFGLHYHWIQSGMVCFCTFQIRLEYIQNLVNNMFFLMSWYIKTLKSTKGGSLFFHDCMCMYNNIHRIIRRTHNNKALLHFFLMAHSNPWRHYFLQSSDHSSSTEIKMGVDSQSHGQKTQLRVYTTQLIWSQLALLYRK